MTNENALLTSSPGRGGYRENAGRKSSWQHSETQTIRVPKVFALALMKLAHKLDSGENIDTETKSKLGGIDNDTDSNLPGADIVTDSKQLLHDTETKSKLGEIDNDTDSNLPGADTETKSKLGEIDNDTDSNLPGADIVTDSIWPLKEALLQAQSILKAKRSARESLAKLLSALYHTQIRPDDLA